MINLSDSTIFVIHKDGSSVPFDSQELQSRLVNLCIDAGITDAWVAGDIALSVEFALLHRLRDSESPSVKAEDIDAIVIRVLEDIGFSRVADEYRKTLTAYNVTAKIPIAELSAFISRELDITGAQLVSISGKVRNSLISIGAEQPNGDLVLELAKHFRALAVRKISSADIEMPDFTSTGGAKVIDGKLIFDALSPGNKEFVEKRILKLYPVNLKIFQYLRIDVRLTGLAEKGNLAAPLTELSLAPHLLRLADVIDAVCLAADAICREKKFEDVVPLKLLLCFSDMTIFAREWMGCHTPAAVESASRELASALRSMLARVPFKVICN